MFIARASLKWLGAPAERNVQFHSAPTERERFNKSGL